MVTSLHPCDYVRERKTSSRPVIHKATHIGEILDAMDTEWSPAYSRMRDDAPKQHGFEGDDFLDGLSDMQSLLVFFGEYNMAPCACVGG